MKTTSVKYKILDFLYNINILNFAHHLVCRNEELFQL